MNSSSAAISALRSPSGWRRSPSISSGGHLFGVYLLSQACVVVTYWAVFALGRSIVGAQHAALAVLTMVAIVGLHGADARVRAVHPRHADLGDHPAALLARGRRTAPRLLGRGRRRDRPAAADDLFGPAAGRVRWRCSPSSTSAHVRRCGPPIPGSQWSWPGRGGAASALAPGNRPGLLPALQQLAPSGVHRRDFHCSRCGRQRRSSPPMLGLLVLLAPLIGVAVGTAADRRR